MATNASAPRSWKYVLGFLRGLGCLAEVIGGQVTNRQLQQGEELEVSNLLDDAPRLQVCQACFIPASIEERGQGLRDLAGRQRHREIVRQDGILRLHGISQARRVTGGRGG